MIRPALLALLPFLALASISPANATETSISATSLDELLKKVQAIAKQESVVNKQRESEFLKQKNL